MPKAKQAYTESKPCETEFYLGRVIGLAYDPKARKRVRLALLCIEGNRVEESRGLATAELAKYLGCSPTSLAKLLKYMEPEEVQAHRRGRRTYSIWLTEAGIELAEADLAALGIKRERLRLLFMAKAGIQVPGKLYTVTELTAPEEEVDAYLRVHRMWRPHLDTIAPPLAA